MTGKIRRFPFDPNYRQGNEKFRVKRDRGAGFYYHRGHGQWSKIDTPEEARQRIAHYKRIRKNHNQR